MSFIVLMLGAIPVLFVPVCKSRKKGLAGALVLFTQTMTVDGEMVRKSFLVVLLRLFEEIIRRALL